MENAATAVSERFEYRTPAAADAERIFECYAADPAVCQYVGWPRHNTVDDTKTFLDLAASEWENWPAGPFLILDRTNHELVGSTGLAFASATEASTGYVVAPPFWGQGIASEALRTMLELSGTLGVERLSAVCHPDHRASRRVLEKAAFVLDAHRPDTLFPNLSGGVTVPAVSYSCQPQTLQASSG